MSASTTQLSTLILATFLLLTTSVIGNEIRPNALTFGTVLKLEHIQSGHRLHSHELPYAGGSGQQSVTGQPLHGDSNSFWFVKQPHPKEHDESGDTTPPTGEPIKCGATIRLQHLNTGKNLHSHLVSAPMNDDYEVSAYARNTDEVWKDGDTGDDWIVQCEGARNGDAWLRTHRIYLKHVDTDAYLTSNSRLVYDEPIRNQLHVSARTRKNRDCVWRAAEGFFMSLRTKQ